MTAIDGLPPLRDVIRRHGLSARKSLGQNFLLDLNLTLRIARTAGPLDGVDVVEIGPGPGGLTRALLKEGARQVIAFERDSRAIAALAEIAAHYQGRLTVSEADALVVPWQRPPLPCRPPVRIVANLPYNIATALLLRWLLVDPWPPWYDAMVLMFQREVAERIVAGPGDKPYGRLGVMAGLRTQAKILFDIAPSAFVPPPKVTSSVVRLVPRETPAGCDVAVLERVTAAAFGQRRKMLRQSLRALLPDPQPLFQATGVDPAARAEEIAVDGFVALTNAFTALRADQRPRTDAATRS